MKTLIKNVRIVGQADSNTHRTASILLAEKDNNQATSLLVNDQEGNCTITDILCEEGKITLIEPSISVTADMEVVDAEGAYAIPGLIDIHTHLDDTIGSFYLADTYRTGSMVAILNGVTTLFSFITESKEFPLSQAIENARQKAQGNCLCDYHWHITPINYSEEAFETFDSIVNQGFRSFKVYTTYKNAGIYLNYNQIDYLAAYLKSNNCKLLVHCEDEEVLMKNAGNYKYLNQAKSHALVRPEIAEIKAVQKILDICLTHQLPVHIVHVSSAESVELIKQCQKALPVSFETCPQYLFLNDEYLNRIQGHEYLCSPPLRSAENSELMREHALNGDIDCFATDHCAFLKEDKDIYRNDFRKVPNGLPGIGSLFSLVFEMFLKAEKNEEINVGLLARLTYHLSEMPAKITGIYPQKGCLDIGSDADLVIFKKGDAKPIMPSFADTYNPYEGFTSRLDIVLTVKSGQIVVKNGQIIREVLGKELTEREFL